MKASDINKAKDLFNRIEEIRCLLSELRGLSGLRREDHRLYKVIVTGFEEKAEVFLRFSSIEPMLSTELDRLETELKEIGIDLED